MKDRIVNLLIVLFVIVILGAAACGGGGDDSPDPADYGFQLDQGGDCNQFNTGDGSSGNVQNCGDGNQQGDRRDTGNQNNVPPTPTPSQ